MLVTGFTKSTRVLSLLKLSFGPGAKPPLPVTVNSLPIPFWQGFSAMRSPGSVRLPGNSTNP
ncbi:MAG: hypothetical protein NHB32_17745 [Fischerella sp. CENA71]|nr:hypothetical protein [Fischerella sp. CENA71]